MKAKESPKGVFVTGTDTGVGKTIVSAWLVRSWNADYWKPVQSGTDEGYDSHTVRKLAIDAVIHPSAYELRAPLSPHEAAKRENLAIKLDAFVLPVSQRFLVVEGAGGALVPLNEREIMTDLMARLGLPVLVVARSGLGTINHTLLTLEALKSRGLSIAGVVMNGTPNPDNKKAIEQFSGAKVVAELPQLNEASALSAHPALTWRYE